MRPRQPVLAVAAALSLLTGACSSAGERVGEATPQAERASAAPLLASTPTPTPKRTFLDRPCSRLPAGKLEGAVGAVQAQQSKQVCAYTRGAQPVLAVTYLDVGNLAATAGAEQALSNPVPLTVSPGLKAWSGQPTGAPAGLVVVKGAVFATVVLGPKVPASKYAAIAEVVGSAL